MVYHLIVAVLSIALLFCGWVWVQRRASREECEGLADEQACAVGLGCRGCARAPDANDRRENRRLCDSPFPGERAWLEQASQR